MSFVKMLVCEECYSDLCNKGEISGGHENITTLSAPFDREGNSTQNSSGEKYKILSSNVILKLDWIIAGILIKHIVF